MSYAIEVKGVSKRYPIHYALERTSDSLKSSLADLFSSSQAPTGELWALKDINLQIPEGQRLGVIGRNGAGKSTLLKILSRITKPTIGTVSVRGKVTSLLEVGTGFHPELTGRENIFLSGAVLGMNREAIQREFDAIVAFSELEQFLDTPVKRYSSGMFMRLAFAVAAHLDSEIMIIDEVLSVGDFAFQEKCFQKMGEFNSQGRTLLFVTHQLSSILSLCDRALYLDQGRIAALDTPQRCVDLYLNRYSAHHRTSWEGESGDVSMRATGLFFEEGERGFFFQDDEVVVELEYRVEKPLMEQVNVDWRLYDRGGALLGTIRYSKDYSSYAAQFAVGDHTLRLKLRKGMLYPGEYTLHLHAFTPKKEVIAEGQVAVSFRICSNQREVALDTTQTGICLGQFID